MWAKGILNKADYYTKHFAPSHHVRMRPTLFVREKTCVTTGKHSFKPTRAINRVPARAVSTKIARMSIILPCSSLKPRSPTINNFRPSRCQNLTSNTVNISSRTRFKILPLNSPVVNKMTLQGCVSTNILPILPLILSPVFARRLTSLSSLF